MGKNVFVMQPKSSSGRQVDARLTYTDEAGAEYWCIPIEELKPAYFSGLKRYDDDEGKMEPQGGGKPE